MVELSVTEEFMQEAAQVQGEVSRTDEGAFVQEHGWLGSSYEFLKWSTFASLATV
jgi:hypothetical protein